MNVRTVPSANHSVSASGVSTNRDSETLGAGPGLGCGSPSNSEVTSSQSAVETSTPCTQSMFRVSPSESLTTYKAV